MMTRRDRSLFLDTLALLGFGSLTSWRFTGIIAHEWLGLFLLGIIVVHLLIHADWIEARLRAVRQGGWRRGSAALWLNAALFLAMGSTLVSGVVISKVVMPNSLKPGAYLNWHSLHESATLATLVILGLHLALNWDLIRAGVRRRAQAAAPIAEQRSRLITFRLSRVAWLIAGVVLLSGTVVGVEALVPPATEVYVYRPDGSIETIAPPAELTAIQPGSETPSPIRGGGKLLAQMAVLALVAAGGRRILKLRLS